MNKVLKLSSVCLIFFLTSCTMNYAAVEEAVALCKSKNLTPKLHKRLGGAVIAIDCLDTEKGVTYRVHWHDGKMRI